jgi:hypothetical protein
VETDTDLEIILSLTLIQPLLVAEYNADTDTVVELALTAFQPKVGGLGVPVSAYGSSRRPTTRCRQTGSICVYGLTTVVDPLCLQTVDQHSVYVPHNLIDLLKYTKLKLISCQASPKSAGSGFQHLVAMDAGDIGSLWGPNTSDTTSKNTVLCYQSKL